MSALNLVQIPIRPGDLARWAGDRGWSTAKSGVGTFDEGLALHHLLAETFGPGALQPFRYLVAPRARVGNLYAYSAQSAEALCEAAGIQAMPEHVAVADPGRLCAKPMPTTWRPGQRVGFDVRLRPVRRLKSDLGDRFKAGREIDAFLHEALKNHAEAKNGMRGAGRNREAVYLDWLAERLALAAVLDRRNTRLVAFQRLRVVRGDKSVEGPNVVIHGALVISDPVEFAKLLTGGVGRHCAYGYGMLLLRAPQTRVPER